MKIILTVLTFIIFFFGCERPINISNADDGIPPAVPIGISVYFEGDAEVILDWIYNSEPDFKGYNIYRSSVNDSAFEKIFFTANNYFFDDSLNYETEYFYKISAVDIYNHESSQSSAIAAKPINKFKPKKPRFINIIGQNLEGVFSIHLRWQPNDESDIKQYNIYRSAEINFMPDSLNLIGSSNLPEFSDTNNLNLYATYYYKIIAVDKGNLFSVESELVSDQIIGIPKIIFPNENENTNAFNQFKINAIALPATYEIIVQQNKYYGNFWSRKFNSNIINDTIEVEFNPPYLENNKTYYWRIAVYTSSDSEPNSVSQLHQFTIK